LAANDEEPLEASADARGDVDELALDVPLVAAVTVGRAGRKRRQRSERQCETTHGESPCSAITGGEL